MESLVLQIAGDPDFDRKEIRKEISVEDLQISFGAPLFILCNRHGSISTYVFIVVNDQPLASIVRTIVDHYQNPVVTLVVFPRFAGIKLTDIIVKYGTDAIEIASYSDLAGYINALAGQKENEDRIMHTRLPEMFADNCSWLKFLMAIPGITEKKAKSIKERFRTLAELLSAYAEIGEQKAELLLERTLGRAGSMNVHKCLTSLNPDEII